MRFSFYFLFFFFTIFGYSENLEKPIEIPFKLSPNGHILIQAKVNNVEGNFIFDTGAGVTLLTAKFAEKVGNLTKTNQFYTGHRATGEALETDLYTAKSLTLGALQLYDEPVTVYDIEFPLDGLISLRPFTDRAITIDFKNQKLVVETENSLEARVEAANFKMLLQITNVRDIEVSISTPVLVNDSLKIPVGLDSGAGFGVYRFSDRYMEKLGIDSTKVQSEFKSSYFKEQQGNTYYYTELARLKDAGKNVEIKNFKATFIEGLIYEGIMGINWIGEVMTIDIAHKRMLVE